jgi:tetratricopeptide (TPR) repeat protein
MTLRASLLKQLENPTLTPSQQAELRCEAAREFENVGDYETAREAMGELWRMVGEPPRVEGLDQSTAAEVLLRAGVLTGWIGSNKQIKDAQEIAKNLISQSIEIFESLAYAKKVLEAQTEQAYCYWREGAYDEARVLLQDTVARLTVDSELKAKAVLRSAIVECSAQRYTDALRILTESAPLFERINSQLIKGGYHTELAVVLRNLAAEEEREDYLDRAFVEYTAASFHFEEAGHMPYCALVENNLGYLFFKVGKYTEAHKHLDRARRLFVSLKDSGSVAQVDDTRAQAMLAEGRAAEAERVAFNAVRTLEQGGRQSLLAEALTTHGRAQARLGYIDQAHATLTRAIDIAEQAGALSDAASAALTFIEELDTYLTINEMRATYEQADTWIGATEHIPTLQRMRAVSRLVVRAMRQAGEMPAPGLKRSLRSTLKEVVRRYEHDYIEQALEQTEGKVSHAARLLGLPYQTLAYMLQHRHKDLMPKRTPIIRRHKSIMRQPSRKHR